MPNCNPYASISSCDENCEECEASCEISYPGYSRCVILRDSEGWSVVEDERPLTRLYHSLDPKLGSTASIYSGIPFTINGKDPTDNYRSLNIDQDDKLAEAYGIGDVVASRFHLDGPQYRVMKMRSVAIPMAAHYEVFVACIGDPSSTQNLSGAWHFASDFYPVTLGQTPTVSKDDKYPHKCPYCGGKAYVGFYEVDCMADCEALKP